MGRRSTLPIFAIKQCASLREERHAFKLVSKGGEALNNLTNKLEGMLGGG